MLEVRLLKCFNSARAFSTSSTLRKGVMESLDVLAGVHAPMNNVRSITNKGFIFSEGTLVENKSCLLLGGRIMEFTPDYTIKNGFIVEFDPKSFNFLKLINPQPDLFVIGLGCKSRLLSQTNLEFFNKYGVKLEISDSRAAVKNFDILATERPHQVGAILLPPNV